MHDNLHPISILNRVHDNVCYGKEMSIGQSGQLDALSNNAFIIGGLKLHFEL